MSNNYKQCLVGAVVVFGLALGQLIAGGLTLSGIGGTGRAVYPRVKGGTQIFRCQAHPENRCSGLLSSGVNGSMSRSLSGSGGEHPALSEHFIRYIALYINTAGRSPGFIFTRSIRTLRSPSRLHWMREDHFARWRSRIILRPGKRQKK